MIFQSVKQTLVKQKFDDLIAEHKITDLKSAWRAFQQTDSGSLKRKDLWIIYCNYRDNKDVYETPRNY